MRYKHCIDSGIFILYEDHDDGTADFVEVGKEELTGKINPVRLECRITTYRWGEMRREI